MGCDWYSFTTVYLQGIIFVAKNLPESTIRKYNLLKINIPLNIDLNCINTSFEEKNSTLCIQKNQDCRNILTNRYNKTPKLKRIIEASFDDDLVSIDFGNRDDINTNVEYLYIYPCSSKQSMIIDVPGPYEITKSEIKLLLSNPKKLTVFQEQQLQELDAHYSLTDLPLINFDELVTDKDFQDLKHELFLINNSQVPKRDTQWFIEPKIHDIIISSTSKYLLYNVESKTKLEELEIDQHEEQEEDDEQEDDDDEDDEDEEEDDEVQEKLQEKTEYHIAYSVNE